MNAPFFVELLARNGDVRRRIRVDALPIRLGRGYDNDVILDDVHTAAHHVIVEQAADGGLTLRDLDTKNGAIHKGRRITSMQIDGDTIFRMGHTSLRVRSAEFQVSSEEIDTFAHGWEGRPPAMAGLTLVVMLTLLTTWLSDTQKFEPTRYLLAIALIAGSAMIWSGIWSFANRLFGGQSRFGRHLFIVGCGAVAMEVWSLASAVIAYAFSLDALTRYGSHALLAITAGMVFFHLQTINPGHTKRFLTTSILMALISSALLLVGNYQGSGRLAGELYMPHLLPPSVRMSADKSVDQFLNDAKKLQARVDAERGKSVNAEWFDMEDED